MKIAKELDNSKDNKDQRKNCPICSPTKDKVSMSKLWSWSLKNPGLSPFKWNDAYQEVQQVRDSQTKLDISRFVELTKSSGGK